MIDDQELSERLRATFTHVAESVPVAAPPPLDREPVRAVPRPPTWLLVAAAALVVVGVTALVVARAPGTSVRTGPGPASESPPAPPPATVGGDGRAVTQGSDGTLDVGATASVNGAAIVVEVDVDDGPARATVSVTSDATPPAVMTIDGCDGPTLEATVGFTLGVTTGAAVGVSVDVIAQPCDEGDDGRQVRLDLALPPGQPATTADGPASPTIAVEGDARGRVEVDGVDGCLAEVLVDWGDRTTPDSVRTPSLDDCTGGVMTLVVDGLEHDYPSGTYEQRISVTTTAPDGTGGQLAFVERRIVIDGPRDT